MATEGIDFYLVPNVWHNPETGQYANVDNSAIQFVDGQAAYSISGELLAELLTKAGFKPVKEV